MDANESILDLRRAGLAAIAALVLVVVLPLQGRAEHLDYDGSYGGGVDGRGYGLGIDLDDYTHGYLRYRWYQDYAGYHYYRYYGPRYSYHHYERFHRERRAPRVYAFTIRPERRDYGDINGRPLIDWSKRRPTSSAEVARRGSESDEISVERQLPRRPSRGRGALRRANREAQMRRYPRNAR